MKLSCDRSAARHYADEQGKRYFSVSQVLDVLEPDKYKYVRPEVLQAKSELGTTLHLYFGLVLSARMGFCQMPPRPDGLLGGYFDGMVACIEQHNMVPIRIEEPSVWPGKPCAGCPDTLCYWGGKRIITLPDLKTTADEDMRSHKVQVTAYHRFEDYREARSLRIIYLRKDGTFDAPEVKPNPGYEAWFLNGLNVLVGRETL